jgi:hypothetical protein
VFVFALHAVEDPCSLFLSADGTLHVGTSFNDEGGALVSIGPGTLVRRLLDQIVAADTGTG